MPNQSLLVFAEGLSRIRVTEYVATDPFYRVRYETIEEEEPDPTSLGPALSAASISRRTSAQ